jgi:hypothetical protein
MPRERRNDIAVKIDAAVYRKAKLIAAYRDVTLAEYLTDLLEKPVNRDFQKLKELLAEDDSSSGD